MSYLGHVQRPLSKYQILDRLAFCFWAVLGEDAGSCISDVDRSFGHVQRCPDDCRDTENICQRYSCASDGREKLLIQDVLVDELLEDGLILHLQARF